MIAAMFWLLWLGCRFAPGSSSSSRGLYVTPDFAALRPFGPSGSFKGIAGFPNSAVVPIRARTVRPLGQPYCNRIYSAPRKLVKKVTKIFAWLCTGAVDNGVDNRVRNIAARTLAGR